MITRWLWSYRKCLQKVSWLSVAVVLGVAPLYAQLPALPLQKGNYWAFDEVLNEDRSLNSLRMEVVSQVHLPSMASDQYFGHKAGWNTLFSDTGTPYFKLALDGRTHLFPTRDPDTLLVRSDEQGSIWIRGFTFYNYRTIVKARDQLWLKAEAGSPYYWEVELEGVSMMYNAQDGWMDEGVNSFYQSGPDDQVEARRSGFPLQFIFFARGFIPGLEVTSPHRLLMLGGGLKNASEGTFSVVLLTGVGPIWIPIQTDMTEYQGGRLELSEAKIDGQLLNPQSGTAILPQSWAEIKADSQ